MTRRHDPFSSALASLRARIEAGRDAPGQPIVIQDEARRLRLSTTPVREALGWLCGYGLVERGPTGGFFAPRMEAADLADAYRFRLTCLSAAAELGDPQVAATADSSGPVCASVEGVMEDAVRATGSSALLSAYQRIASRLAPFRAAERAVLGEDDIDRSLLLRHPPEGAGPRWLEGLQAWHQRRITAAPRLVMVAGRLRDDVDRGGEATP
ncbi:GntR family transcriptional regulator [Brevundimonas bacteroides]|uniref:GntR family transcriptional regulator n=1 Tax=Brevundimonas bacteroides TaxID=74311 RepID=UPI000495E215|nr:GntR family transcriptional regulator [Brevundimonas bacteroides]